MNKINPYESPEPVNDPDKFWGRTVEVARIFSRIGAGRPQSVSLIGESKIGKTSLIRYLLSEEVQKEYIEDHEQVLLIGYEIPPELDKGPEEFINHISKLIEKKTNIQQRGSGYEGLTGFFKDEHIAGYKIILCFDDFHRVTENSNYPMEFFSFLRSLANNYNIAYVTTSPLELQRLCVSRVVEESPFFNIFSNITLRPLEQNDAKKIFIEFSKKNNLALEDHVAGIIDWTGSAPDDLRTAFQLIFEEIGASKDVGSFNFDDFKERFLLNREAIYRNRWDAMGPDMQTTLISIIKGKKVNRSYMFIAAELERKGYIVKDPQKFSLCSKSFEKFIASVVEIEIKKSSQAVSWFKKLFN